MIAKNKQANRYFFIRPLISLGKSPRNETFQSFLVSWREAEQRRRARLQAPGSLPDQAQLLPRCPKSN